MQPLRDMFRTSLARGLRTLPEEDRLAAALPLVCGSALASHCEIVGLDRDRTLHVRVDGPEWLESLLRMREIVRHDLQRVSGVSLGALHCSEAGATSNRAPRPSPPGERAEAVPERRRPVRLPTQSH